MLKPLSAITESPGSKRSSRPLCSVMCLSLVFPVHSLEIKVNMPLGEIPTRVLMVLCCL